MSLIPAKHYYGEDTSDQWQRKKQTKEERQNAKRAKLDPESHKSAKDIMDENERKRKRELEGEEGEYGSDLDVGEKEQPLQGLKASGKKVKKLKLSLDSADKVKPIKPGRPEAEGEDEGDATTARKKAKAEKRKEKEQRKKEKLERQQQKTQARKARKEDITAKDATYMNGEDMADSEAEKDAGDDVIEKLDMSGIIEDDKSEPLSTATPTPIPESPTSTVSAIPSASSSSSIVPQSTTEDSEKPKATKHPEVDQEALKARLQARIEALRAARKADGIDGKPARNRQELMEARRRKEEQRKAHKKEVRKQAKEDEERAKADAELARLRGSGSPLTTPDIFSPRREESECNFSFGRVAFEDGQQMDSSLSGFIESQKRKGPQDPRTALEAAEKKRARISGLDEQKRADIEEKDLWLNAKKRAHGEKVRDDMSLLKKTLKRKEKAKLKSESEWNERVAGVQKGQEMRQKKREENLRKRKEEKGSKGKGKAKGKKPGKKSKRPGFEGSFRSKAK